MTLMRLDCGVAGETGADVECMCFQEFFSNRFYYVLQRWGNYQKHTFGD
jgi:hypothetical protein